MAIPQGDAVGLAADVRQPGLRDGRRLAVCVLRPRDPERLQVHDPLNLHDLVHDELQQRRECYEVGLTDNLLGFGRSGRPLHRAAGDHADDRLAPQAH